MMNYILSTASLIAIASAFTQPGAQTYGALLTPDLTSPVTTGQTYDVTWTPNQPADGVTVSLVLCNGPGSNCVLQSSAIAEGIPAASGKYSWSVPCSLPEGTENTASGYGMLIIVDGTGEFQCKSFCVIFRPCTLPATCNDAARPSRTHTDSAQTRPSSLSRRVLRARPHRHPRPQLLPRPLHRLPPQAVRPTQILPQLGRHGTAPRHPRLAPARRHRRAIPGLQALLLLQSRLALPLTHM